jgi:DNA-binding Lrp family transcriptional regulator
MVDELIVASYVRQPMIAHDMSIDKEIAVPVAPRLDETDLRILEYLAEDARLSQRAIARAIGMSPPAVADRISRLETLGVIQGYRAQIDYALLGRTLTVVVGITSERSDNQRELAQEVLAIPEVEGVDLVTGQDDLRVRLRVRDQPHLNEVYFERLLTLPGIRHTETTLVLYGFTPGNFAKQVLNSLTTPQEEA